MVRIDGKLRTVQRAAWEFAYGPLSPGVRVNTCADERACVTVAHLSLTPARAQALHTTGRRQRGSGSIRELHADVWQLAITDTTVQRRRYTFTGGDIIVAVGGKPVSTNNDLLVELEENYRPGDKVNLTVHRDGKKHQMEFRLGDPVAPLGITGDTTEKGTTVRFKASPTIFTNITFDYEILAKRLRELSSRCPGGSRSCSRKSSRPANPWCSCCSAVDR
jgi:hypothetical protein